MKFNPHRAIALICLLSMPAVSHAIPGFRAALVTEVQTGSTGTGGLTYVGQSGAWQSNVPPTPTCGGEYAYFNAIDNPHLLTTVLSARMAGKVLRVYVDDSLTKSGGFCQITFLAVLPD